MHEVSKLRIKIIASTKSELYRLLKNEGNYYLPPKQMEVLFKT